MNIKGGYLAALAYFGGHLESKLLKYVKPRINYIHKRTVNIPK